MVFPVYFSIKKFESFYSLLNLFTNKYLIYQISGVITRQLTMGALKNIGENVSYLMKFILAHTADIELEHSLVSIDIFLSFIQIRKLFERILNLSISARDVTILQRIVEALKNIGKNVSYLMKFILAHTVDTELELSLVSIDIFQSFTQVRKVNLALNVWNVIMLERLAVIWKVTWKLARKLMKFIHVKYVDTEVALHMD